MVFHQPNCKICTSQIGSMDHLPRDMGWKFQKIIELPPASLRDYSSRKYIFQPSFFRGYVSFQGCRWTSMSKRQTQNSCGKKFQPSSGILGSNPRTTPGTRMVWFDWTSSCLNTGLEVFKALRFANFWCLEKTIEIFHMVVKKNMWLNYHGTKSEQKNHPTKKHLPKIGGWKQTHGKFTHNSSPNGEM